MTPEFDIDLIGIAEGACSQNSSVISGQLTIPKVESWYQSNYSGKQEKNLKGFSGLTVDDHAEYKKQITATIHINRSESDLVNVSTYIPPSQEVDASTLGRQLQESARVLRAAGSTIDVSSDQSVVFRSPRIDVDLKRVTTPIRSNVVILGDSAASGSPVGGLGGSLGLSAYPEMVERLIENPDFGSNDPVKREKVENEFKHGIAQIANLRHGEPSDIMTRLGLYPKEINNLRIRQSVEALFKPQETKTA